MPTYFSDEGFPFDGMPETTPLPPNRRAEMLASYQNLFNQGGGMQPLYAQLELDMGLPRGSLAQIAKIESNGDPNSNRNKDTEYKGLFQLGDDVQKLYGVTDPYDPVQNAYAGAQYAQRHRNALPSKLGREPEPYEVYMAHQMGLGGITKLANNRESKLSSLGEIGSNALNQNVRGITGNNTAGDFLDVFKDRYTRGWGEWGYKPEGGLSYDDSAFSGAWYDPTSHKQMPGMNQEESWLREYAPDNAAIQTGGNYYRDVDSTGSVANLTPGGGHNMGDEEAWLRQNAPDNAWLDLDAHGPYSRDAHGNPTMGAEESWERRFAPNAPDLQEGGKYYQAKGGSNTGTGFRWNPDTGTYVPNTDGQGADLSGANRFKDGSLFDPQSPVDHPLQPAAPMNEEAWLRAFQPGAPDLQPGGKFGAPLPAPPVNLVNPTNSGGTATLDLGGGTQGSAGANPSGVTQIPVPNAGTNTGLAPQHSTPMFADLGNTGPVTPINNAPPDVSTNPSASASTIGGPAFIDPNPQWNVPSFGNPSYPGGVFGAAPLGGSSPNPAGTANPFGANPNFMDPYGGGGGPMVLTVPFSSSRVGYESWY